MEYEKQRLKRIEENKQKMQDLGIKGHAYEASCLMDQKKRKIKKMKSKDVLPRDVEYIADEASEVEFSSEDDDKENDDNEIMQHVRSLRPHSKKVVASRGENPVKSSSKPKCSTISMSSMVKMQSQTRKNQVEERIGKNLQTEVLTPNVQQEKSKQNGFPLRAELQKRISVVAPGSLGAYLRMKDKSREQLSNQIYASHEDSIQLRADLYSDYQKENSQKQMADLSSVRLVKGLVDEDEILQSSDDDILEVEKAAESREFENDMVELISKEGHLANQPVSQTQKRKRGPSMLKDVYDRSLDERKPIILNALGQPIGPCSSTLDEFSRFLGSLARDSNLAPLNKISWHQVPQKDQIWEIVKRKYIISEEGKSYVLRSVAALWPNYKCRIKKNHYKAYNNTRDRWNNRPTSIPDSHFRELLKFWKLKKIQEISEKNQVISECQRDRHTSGPVSFARKRRELELDAKIPPSEATMYKETRKRNPERKYKTPCVMEEVQTQEHRTLSGRCTKRVKGPSKSGILIPDEFLQPYKESIMKDTIMEMMNILKQVLPSDMLARIAPSITGPSNNLINGESSSGMNDKDKCKNDGDRDAEANDHDDLERNDEEIEKEY